MKERETLTTKIESRRHSREQESYPQREDYTQEKMDDGRFKWKSSNTGLSYVVEEFTLNSPERVVSRKGKGKRPDPLFCKRSDTGRKQLRKTWTYRDIVDRSLHIPDHNSRMTSTITERLLLPTAVGGRTMDLLSKKVQLTING